MSILYGGAGEGFAFHNPPPLRLSLPYRLCCCCCLGGSVRFGVEAETDGADKEEGNPEEEIEDAEARGESRGESVDKEDAEEEEEETLCEEMRGEEGEEGDGASSLRINRKTLLEVWGAGEREEIEEDEEKRVEEGEAEDEESADEEVPT